ncbi:MAG: efflux RND transporter permease subunit [bacterium]
MFLSNIAIDRPVFTTMVIIAIVIFGLVSYSNLGIDREPDVDLPFLTITTVYPGADPETVESEIIDLIEEEISTLSGIKLIESRAIENVGLVAVEYELEVNIDTAAQDVRARLDSIKREFPTDAESPIVEKLDIGATPVMSLAVSADMPFANLTSFVENQIKPVIEGIDGVGSVKMVGGRDREIHILLDPDAMRERNISVDEIIAFLKISNLEIPGGRIETGTKELVVKTRGRVQVPDDFKDIIIRSTPDGIIRLSDIAEIKDTMEEKRSLARLDSSDAIGLVVRKKSGANTVKVAERIEEKVNNLRKTLPPGIQITIPVDESVFIRGSFEGLLHHLMLGSLWATIIVFFFLRSPRSTLICAVSIPTSIIGTFIFMHAMGFTMNIVSMLGLSSCVGMLIDDAIVVLENIYRHRVEGKGKIEAAKFATTEIGLAVMATTFSIVAVFVPVAYTYGLIGRFLYEFGMTVSFAVMISLFVSFTLIPMLCSKFLVVTDNRGSIYLFMERFFVAMDNGYARILSVAMKRKALTVVIAIVTFIASLFLGSLIPMEFMSTMDEKMFTVSISTPPGSPISRIEEKIVDVEEILKTIPVVETIFSTVGAGAVASVTDAELRVRLVPKEDRKMHQTEVMSLTRTKLRDIHGAKVSVGVSGGGHSSGVDVALMGQDMDDLIKNSEQYMSTLKSEPGFVDIDMSYKSGKPEVRVEIDRDRASSLGISIRDIATTINGFVSGENVVTVFKEAGQDYDLKVRLQEEFRDNPEDLLTIPIRTSTGKLVDLGTIVSIETGSGPSEINHRNGQRSITVSANLEGVPLGPAKDRITAILDEILPPSVNYNFAGMADLMEESFSSLFFAMALAIILIYMLLCSQYENLVHPLSIMLSLPLSLIGAFGGLYLSGMTMSMMTMIGMIMLMGVVTKNAILLVDYTNTLRKRGMERDQAILKAGPIRLRPILMTTSATVMGLLPIAISRGSGSEMNAPVAICIIGGLITSTVLTLVVVPVVYSLLDGFTVRISNLFTRK